MTKREAYLVGRETGKTIGESSLHYFNPNPVIEIMRLMANEWHTNNKDVGPKDAFCLYVSEIESEHCRQFAPFEERAKTFNESHDPDGMWSEYERGVWNGAKQVYMKNRSTKKPLSDLQKLFA